MRGRIVCAIVLTAKKCAEKFYKKHIDIVFMIMLHANMKLGADSCVDFCLFKGDYIGGVINETGCNEG